MAAHATSQGWPLWWRLMVLLNVSFYNLVRNAFAAGVTPLFGLIMGDLHCSVNEASHLATYALLALGLSNLLALPASAVIGKRYTVLLTQIIFFATNIWAAKVPNFDQLLATRFVGGLAAGVIEALGPRFVYETFPEKSLSKAMAIYTSFLALGASFGPLVSGLIAGSVQDWRWFFWLLSIVSGINFLGSFLLLPETSLVPDGSDQPVSQMNEQKSKDPDHVEINAIETAAPEVPAERCNWWQVWYSHSFYLRLAGRSNRGLNWNPLSSLRLLVAPPVFVTVLVYGITIGWSLVASIVIAAVFQSPPYLWSATAMGIFGVSGIVGIILGIPFGGALTDYLASRAAQRNMGAYQAEARLPALIPPGIVSPLGVLIIAIYLSKNEIWVGQAVGQAMLSFGGSSATTTLLTYAVDCFPHRAGEIGVLVNVVKNCVGFGLSYASIPWVLAQGPKAQFGVMAGLLWFAYCLAIPLYYCGPRLRNRLCRELME